MLVIVAVVIVVVVVVASVLFVCQFNTNMNVIFETQNETVC
jgi:hypothetical protein